MARTLSNQLHKGAWRVKQIYAALRSQRIQFQIRILFIIVTGIGWAVLFWQMKPQDKWGQVVGNIVSEWVQMAGLVFLTKRLVEVHSKES